MGLPKKLKNFATFVDGENYMGQMPEVTLPTLTRKTEGYRGGGMNGEIEIDLGMEGMEAEFKAAGWLINMLKTWGTPRHDGLLVRFAGALQPDDTGEVEQCECVMRGRIKEFDPGGAQAGEKTEQTYKVAVSYYKLSIAGQTVLEIDLPNLVEMVGAEDRLAQIRAALGV